VTREADPDDRRALRLRPTADGERALRDSHARMVATATAALREWSDDEVAEMASRLGRLREDFAAAATSSLTGAAT
jgi:DNA-binding MarR family transcriptional regulator